jgi:hypothetical protein
MKFALLILPLAFSTSCGWPITVGIQSDAYGVGGTYSSKGGLKLIVDADKIIDRDSGK